MFQSRISKGDLLFYLGLVIIVLVAIFLTFWQIKIHQKVPEVKNEVFKSVSKMEVINIHQKYQVNPIDIIFEDKVKIKGLINKEVEEKINKKLEKLDFDDKNVCNVNFNISNVLSISCNEKSVNVNLIDGADIILETVFNKGTDLRSILLKAIYYRVCDFNNCLVNSYVKDNQVENEVVRIFNKIKLRDYEWMIYTNGIYIDEVGYVEFEDYLDEVTIYERFLSDENIYEKNSSYYCYPQGCNDIMLEDSVYYVAHEWVGDNNYLSFYFYNNSQYDILMQDAVKKDVNIKEVGEMVKKALINKYKLDKDNGYQNIYGYATMYYKSVDECQVMYDFSVKEYDKEDISKAVFNTRDVKNIKEDKIVGVDLIIDKDNRVRFLEDDPRKVIDNFEEKLYSYINEDLKLYGNKSVFNGYNPCYKGTCQKDYYKLIKEASYAVDIDDKLFYMYYVSNDSMELESYVNKIIPFDFSSHEVDI